MNSQKKQHIGLDKYIFIIIGLGLAVYAAMFTNTFVWDDTGYVYASPFTRPLYLLKDVFTNPGQALYRPLFYVYLNIISILSQGNPFIIHLLQLGLHIGSAVLLFFLFKKYMRPAIALCCALLFVVHPITTEAVTYMAAIGNVLVCFFGLLALLQLMDAKQHIRRYFVAGFFLLLALLTNEAGISWIFIALSALWIVKKLKISYMLALLVPPLGIYGLLRFFIAHTQQTLSSVPIGQVSFAERLLTMPKIFSYYLMTVFYPAYLAIAQHWIVTTINFQNFILPICIDAAFLLAFIAAGIYLSRTHKPSVRPYLFFSLWFLVGIAPYLQIIPLDMTVADRWFYIPLAGLLGMVGVVVQTIKFSRVGKIIGSIIMALLLIALGSRTIVRNGNWRDGITLFTHDAHINPDSFDIHAKLAAELMTAKRYDEAMIHAQKAVALNPDDISSLGTLALLFIQEQKPQQAIGYLQKLLVQDPKNYPGLTNLMYAYLLTGNKEEAKTYALKALEMYPNDETLLMFLNASQQ